MPESVICYRKIQWGKVKELGFSFLQRNVGFPYRIRIYFICWDRRDKEKNFLGQSQEIFQQAIRDEIQKWISQVKGQIAVEKN